MLYNIKAHTFLRKTNYLLSKRKRYKMEKRLFGRVEDKNVYLYTLNNDECTVELMNFGAAIVRFAPYGHDIVGGFDTLEGYVLDKSNQGVTVGRVCNRIEDATLTLDGAVYMLTVNDGPRGNCLHGGVGFDKKVWEIEDEGESTVAFSYYSPDGEDGFPSGVRTSVRYTLIGTELIIQYKAIPEGKTPIALTNHCFFNLDGFGDTVFAHTLTLYGEKYSAVNDKLIPTGERPSVYGTPFDFTTPHAIGERIDKTGKGYDHNYLLSPVIFKDFNGKSAGLAAVAENGKLRLSVYTDQPCIQFYSANFLGGSSFDSGLFRGGVKPLRHGAFCLEAQTEPNCCNHGEAIYDAGEVYTQITVYSIEKIG